MLLESYISIALLISGAGWGIWRLASHLDRREKLDRDDKWVRAKLDRVGMKTDVNVWLAIDEYHEYEPSNYCYDPGWTAFLGDHEFFISISGVVYNGHDSVGICPSVEARAWFNEAKTLDGEMLDDDLDMIQSIYEKWGIVALSSS